MNMDYLSKFDSSGKRITSYPLDNSIDDKKRGELIADGYVEISEEEWSHYVGNKGAGANGTGYIRGADGKPTDAPAYVPTKEERLAALDVQYDNDKDTLAKYYLDAVLSGDADLQDELKAELDALNAQYETARKEIEEG
jgi:hypothetical protein